MAPGLFWLSFLADASHAHGAESEAGRTGCLWLAENTARIDGAPVVCGINSMWL